MVSVDCVFNLLLNSLRKEVVGIGHIPQRLFLFFFSTVAFVDSLV